MPTNLRHFLNIEAVVLFLAAVAMTLAFLSPGFAAEEVELLREAESKYRQRRYNEAAELASQAIERDGPSVAAYRLRSAAFESLRRFDDAIADVDRWIKLRPETPEAYQARGTLQFKAGHIRASIADFDRFLELRPERKPHHWQRGISYYYAGEYKKGVRQFELHKTVNAQDVENAVWHYLCKARVDGVDAARSELIDITGDSRPWAMKVYHMFQGKLDPQQVLQHAERTSGTEAERRNNLFYAHLYVGLFHESASRPEEALRHITIAVKKYPSPHYMGDVARVHLGLKRK